MFGFNLGPALLALFIYQILIPSILGFVIGSWIGKRITQEQKLRLRYALIGMVLFPFLWVVFNYFQTVNYKNINQQRLLEYRKNLIESYDITEFTPADTGVVIGVKVPREGKYDIYLSTIDSTPTLLNREASQEYQLDSGNNIVSIPTTSDKLFSNYSVRIMNSDFNYQFIEKKSLYRSNSTSRPYFEGIIYYSEVFGDTCPVYNHDDLPCVASKYLTVTN